MRMYRRSVDSCAHNRASSVVDAATRLLGLLHVWLLWSFLHYPAVAVFDCQFDPCRPGTCTSIQRKVLYSPVNVGGCILYLCMMMTLCAGALSACVVACCVPSVDAVAAIVVDDSRPAVLLLFCLLCLFICIGAHLDCRTRITAPLPCKIQLVVSARS